MINAHQRCNVLVGILSGYRYSMTALSLRITGFVGMAFAIGVGVLMIWLDMNGIPAGFISFTVSLLADSLLSIRFVSIAGGRPGEYGTIQSWRCRGGTGQIPNRGHHDKRDGISPQMWTSSP